MMSSDERAQPMAPKIASWILPESWSGPSAMPRQSDWPAASFDPRDVMADVVGAPSDASSPDPTQSSAVLLRSAVDAYTGQAAFASYDEQRKGTLAPGMLADIVIFSNDIFQNPPQSLKDTAVTVTIFDGKVVYQRPAAGTTTN